MPATKLKVVSANSAKNQTYNSIQRFALEGLSDLIRVLMENVDDALFELSDKVDNDQERNMYFDAMREVRLKREAIKRDFDNEMQDSFGRAFRAKPKPADIDEDDTELTLLEYDDLEDNIAISNMIKRARPQFEGELYAVTERLKLVLKCDSLEADENPLDPQAICDCFHNASELLETDIQIKLIFYKLFERYVINNLGHFYREVNQQFVEKGVLPGFKVDQERMKQTTRFMTNRIRNNATPTAFDGVASSGVPASAAPGIATGAEGDMFAALQQVIGTPTQASVTGQASTPGSIPTGNISAADDVSALSNLQSAR